MEKNLLVIDSGLGGNWYEIFGRGQKLKNGVKIRVEQAGWKDIILMSSSERGCKLVLRGKGNDCVFIQQKNEREFSPDFVLVRNNFNLSLFDESYKNVLLGLMFANIPAVNSFDSIYSCSEKPIAYGKMLGIQKELGGFDKFPLIPQVYYPNCRSSCARLMKEKEFPVVVKMGTVHAGAGKMRITSENDFDDLLGIMMLTKYYFTTEPFVDIEMDYRLQKIGNNYRVYKRKSSTHWKNNSGTLQYIPEDKIEERYKLWMDKVSEAFPGLDIFALDVLKMKDGKEVICELNDTAIGLMYDFERIDNKLIRDLVLEKMNDTFCKDE